MRSPAFLAETLAPRPGNRILDVGCGEGLAEVEIGRLHISQLRLFGVDLVPSKVAAARQETLAHNQRVGFAAADACRLPFKDGAFDSIYCVAVLQHIDQVDTAVAEFARVTTTKGRVVAVEPDNTARYGFSSTPLGRRAFELSAQFFIALDGPRGDRFDHWSDASRTFRAPRHRAALGPAVSRVANDPRSTAAVDVAGATRGGRERAANRQIRCRGVARPRVPRRAHGYEREANAAGSSFVEIQNTMLFATVGQKS